MFQTTNQKSGASNTIQMWKSRQLRRRGIQPLFRRQWTSTDPHGRQPGFAALPHLQPLPHRPQWMGEPLHKTTGNAELKEKVLSFPSNFVHFLVFANVCLQFHVIVHLKVHVLKFHFLRTTASVWCVKCVCVCLLPWKTMHRWVHTDQDMNVSGWWCNVWPSPSPFVFSHGVVQCCSSTMLNGSEPQRLRRNSLTFSNTLPTILLRKVSANHWLLQTESSATQGPYIPQPKLRIVSSLTMLWPKVCLRSSNAGYACMISVFMCCTNWPERLHAEKYWEQTHTHRKCVLFYI